MKRATQLACARVLTASAGGVLFVALSFMLVDYGVTYGQRERYTAYAAQLEQQVKQNDALSPVLEAEWDRQTRDSLARARRTDIAVNFVIAAVVLLVTGAKWSSILHDRPLPTCARAIAHRTAASNGKSKRRRRSRRSPALAHGSCACSHPDQDLDLTFVDEAVARYGRTQSAVIPLLQAIQAHRALSARGCAVPPHRTYRDHSCTHCRSGLLLHSLSPCSYRPQPHQSLSRNRLPRCGGSGHYR